MPGLQKGRDDGTDGVKGKERATNGDTSASTGFDVRVDDSRPSADES